MKTVQDWVRELDKEKLIEVYFRAFPIKYEGSNEKESMTVKALKDAYYQAFSEYIDRICVMKTVPNENGSECIFCCGVTPGFPDDEYRYALFDKQEILEMGTEATEYDFSIEGQDHIMGYLVAETAFTREHIYEVIASILYEASFFGYNEEGLEEARSDFYKAQMEMEEREKNGWQQTEEEKEYEEYLRSQISYDKPEGLQILENQLHEAQLAYERFFQEHELREIQKELRSQLEE